MVGLHGSPCSRHLSGNICKTSIVILLVTLHHETPQSILSLQQYPRLLEAEYLQDAHEPPREEVVFPVIHSLGGIEYRHDGNCAGTSCREVRVAHCILGLVGQLLSKEVPSGGGGRALPSLRYDGVDQVEDVKSNLQRRGHIESPLEAVQSEHTEK